MLYRERTTYLDKDYKFLKISPLMETHILYQTEEERHPKAEEGVKYCYGYRIVYEQEGRLLHRDEWFDGFVQTEEKVLKTLKSSMDRNYDRVYQVGEKVVGEVESYHKLLVRPNPKSTCKGCNREMNLDKFYPCNYTSSKVAPYCKRCMYKHKNK